ncbi:D-xylulose kinase [Clavulina sp. PMI_390]|nr:D-xylulose kinase [Clavulina sp. PMI_390]
MALFLGLDLSTQSLKSTVCAADGHVIAEKSVNFHRDLPKYGTSNGAIAGPDGEMTTPVALWVESLDIVMKDLQATGVDFSKIVGVSGAGQQHGSVYWSNAGLDILQTLDPKQTLLEQLVPAAFSLPNAPIWQDSSTTAECRALEAAVGGPQALADLTGSRAYERFTGSQIMKVRNKKPEAYAATRYISLVSSFAASLFLGSIAPIESSDASGMNLMSLHTSRWDDTLLEACGGPELRAKLGGEPAVGGATLGLISRWWVDRYNFSPDCIIAPFTGDNPSTIVTLSSPGDCILSFGTSTTLLVSIPPPSDTVPPPACSTSSHILAHPTTSGGSIYMLCYKNGGLTRELVRDHHSEKSWAKFNEQIEGRPTGNAGYLGFYFTLKEIIPDGVQGDYFFRDGQKLSLESESTSFPEDAHARAVVESQLLSIRARLIDTLGSTTAGTQAANDPNAPKQTFAEAARLKRCIVTGGSSANHVMQQLAADVLGLPVYTAASGGGSATTGGALLAKFAWWKGQQQKELTEMNKAQDCRNAFNDVLALDRVAEPIAANELVYSQLLDTFRACEKLIVDETRAGSGVNA